jgi:hypothetical protein
MASLGLAESSGNPGAVSSAGALGLFQFMPGTAKGLGINPLQPGSAASGANTYLTNEFTWLRAAGYTSSNAKTALEMAIAGYNEGQGAMEEQINAYKAKYGTLPTFAQLKGFTPTPGLKPGQAGYIEPIQGQSIREVSNVLADLSALLSKFSNNFNGLTTAQLAKALITALNQASTTPPPPSRGLGG